jgi:gliding motility associated protien GldN
MKNSFLWVGVFVLPTLAISQSVYDSGFSYVHNKVKDRKVVPWPFLKEADVMFVKRVERIIDIREKQNQVMGYPPNPLATIIYDAVKNGQIAPYENDEMSSEMSINKFLSLGTDSQFIEVVTDPNDPSFTTTELMVDPFNAAERIKKYRVVEDWIFDKTRSQYYVRIVSIAPQYEMRLGGVNLGWQDLCMLKYYSKDEKDLRHLLVDKMVFNRQTNSPELSYDDWFEQRLFSSYIIKTSNQNDSYIKNQTEFKDNGTEALIEAERKQRELQEREENLYED